MKLIKGVVVGILLSSFLQIIKGEEDAFPEMGLPECLSGETIAQIAFQGNRRIGEETLLKRIKIKKGEPFFPRRLRADVKRLYKMGYFKDIKVKAEGEWEGGIRLTFILRENPIVQSIELEGNKRIKEEEIFSVLSLKEGDFYDPIKGRKGSLEITRLYRERGYYFASVNLNTVFDEEANTVELRFKIAEGRIIKIKRINFKGNTAISSLRLLWYMETKREGVYREEILEKDVEKIRLLYLDKGYALVLVEEPCVKYDDRMKGLIITIKIDEGPQFRIGGIFFSGNTLFPSTYLKEVMGIETGDVYSMKRFHEGVFKIKELYAEKGYVGVRVRPIPSLDYINKKIALHLKIHEGKRYYLEGIRIEGNKVTRDNVIQRELLIASGEVFDGKKLRLSRQRLFNLGYFEEINMEILPGSAEDRKILLIRVKERKTGVATIGAGYSSREGLVGNIQVSQINLFGRGWKVRLSADFGGRLTRYDFTFLNPWVFDTPTSFRFRLYDTRTDNDTYWERRRGGSVGFGFRMGLYNRLFITHRRDGVEIFDVKEGAPEDIEEGFEAVNTFSFDLSRDTTDSPLFPTRGYKIELENEMAGGILKGDIDFYKPEIKATVHLPFLWKLILSLRGRWSIITNPFSQKEIPDYEKFYLGGSGSVRGYRDRSIHPLDKEGNIVGGEGMLVGSIEVGIPVAEEAVRIYGFFDAGNSWLRPEDIRVDELKYGIGIGILFYSPIGPIRFDYGYPIGDPEHRDPQFHFGIGPLF